jgi:hypothetical protein
MAGMTCESLGQKPIEDTLVLPTLIKKILIYKEILSGAVAKSYMRKGFLIYGERRKYFPIYEEVVSHILLCNCSILNFLIYEENLIFFFISVAYQEQQILDLESVEGMTISWLNDPEFF